MRIFISKMPISSSNPMLDHLLESSHRDDYNKWSNIVLGQEIMDVMSTEFDLSVARFIWNSGILLDLYRHRQDI